MDEAEKEAQKFLESAISMYMNSILRGSHLRRMLREKYKLQDDNITYVMKSAADKVRKKLG